MSVPFPACALALLLTPLTAGATPGGAVLLLVPDGADLGVVRAARAATTPVPLLVGAGRTIALDGGLSVAADLGAAEAPEAATLVLLPGPATPALDALLRARRASAETILLIEPARPDLLTSLPGGAALVLTGRVEAIRKLAGSGTPQASPVAAPPPPVAAAATPIPPAPAATPVKAKTFDRYFAAATPTPRPPK
jgi:hypothetical protein